MAATFEDAPAVKEIAEAMMSTFHAHLVEANIRYLFRFGEWSAKGRTTLGMAYKVGARDKFLTGLDFIVVINGDEWKNFTMGQRRALVDHELCHCGRTDDEEGNWTWCIWGHDLEEFRAIVERHGLWEPELRRFGEAAAKKVTQLTLFAGGREVNTTTGELAEVAAAVAEESR